MTSEELVDLVDADGVVQKRRVAKSDIRTGKDAFLRAGLYQPIVVVVVVDYTGRVIGQVRGEGKGDDSPGEIDHVCGIVSSGESWLDAANREALEELGVHLTEIHMILRGVNTYQRHRTLAVARTVSEPRVVNEKEVARVVVARPSDYEDMAARGAVFVRGFFEDMAGAIAWLNGSMDTARD